MSFLKNILLSSSMLCLSACSYFSDHGYFRNQDSNYLAAKNTAPLAIPKGTAANHFENAYPVSSRPYPTVIRETNIEPPGL